MTRAVLACALAALGGCATTTPGLDSSNSAELSFSRTAAPGGLSGKFDSVDGKRLEGTPLVIRVPSGKHEVGYSCPDVITLDLQPAVTWTFVAGRSYLLDCGANEPGAVRER